MKTIKNTILFFTFLLIFCVVGIFAHPAWGIVVDHQKQVFFSDLENVWKIDKQGKFSIFREGESGRHVHDLAIDSSDNIYGMDESFNPQTQKYSRALWKMTPSGEFSYIISPTENVSLQMSIWKDSAGNTYTVEPYNNDKKEAKIIKYAPDGTSSLLAGGKYGYQDGQKENAEFSVITDMAFGPDNTVYVTNDDKVRKIDKAGNVTTIYRETENPNKNPNNLEPFSRLFGLAVDKQNNVFVADFYNNHLLKISPDGKVAPVFNSENDWSPIGVTATDDGLYVLEARPYSSAVHTGNRVLKIASNGNSELVGNLDDAIKTKDASDKNEIASGKTNDTTATTDNKDSTDKSLYNSNALLILGIIGAVGVALVAFIMLVRKK